MTDVDLAKLLLVPENSRTITADELVEMGKMVEDDGELNTAQDDTIIEGEVNEVNERVRNCCNLPTSRKKANQESQSLRMVVRKRRDDTLPGLLQFAK